jgi:hypothetical protein
VRKCLRAARYRGPSASLLPSGLPQGLRCGRAPLGGRGDRYRNADHRCAAKRLRRNARVGAGSRLARVGTEAREPVPVALTERYDEAKEPLDELLIALLVELPDIWDDLAAALPDEIYDRVDRWMEARFVP